MVKNKIVIKPTLEPIHLIEQKKKKKFWLRPYYRPFFFIAVPLNLLSIFFSGFFWRFLPPLIPLFYNRLEIKDQLVKKEWVFILPIIALMITVVHFLVIWLARRYDQTLLKVFSYITIFLQLLVTAVLLRIILIVI
jgi:hypothetical protein